MPTNSWRLGNKGVTGRKPGWRKRRHTQWFSWIPPRYQPASNPTVQKHRCLTDHTRYYGIRNSIFGYGILVFLMRTLQCCPPKPPDPLQHVWHRLWGDSRTYLQQSIPGHFPSQQSAWWKPLPSLMGLHPSISTCQTPNTSGTYQIREGDLSG